MNKQGKQLSKYIKDEIKNGKRNFDIGVYPEGEKIVVDNSSPNRIKFSIKSYEEPKKNKI